VLRVFVSYSREDEESAKALLAALNSLGVATSEPERSSGGDEWLHSLMHGIAEADAFVGILPASRPMGDHWLSYEAGLAYGLGKSVMLASPVDRTKIAIPPDLAALPVARIPSDMPLNAARLVVEYLEHANAS
jgi:nucleoside 2-deoxyribosyltransferase